MGVIIYPEKIKNGDTLGITAVSMPANKDKIDLSIKNIESLGLNVIETNNVRQNGIVSSNAKTRAEELLELYKNPEVKYIIAARGGEFLMEMLPFLNEHKDIIKNNPEILKNWDSEVGDRIIKLVFIGQNLEKEEIKKELDNILD